MAHFTPPKGFTESEVVSIINKVANRLCRRFRFGYFEIEDIKQEARMFALEALPKYDGVRSLENFLWTHVKNHLGNLKRNKFERRTPPCYDCKHCCLHNKSAEEQNRKLEACEIYQKWIARNNSKKNLMTPIEYEGVRDTQEDHMKDCVEANDAAIAQELSDIIDRHLPTKYRKDYAKLKLGVHVVKSKKEELRQVIKEILEQNKYSITQEINYDRNNP